MRQERRPYKTPHHPSPGHTQLVPVPQIGSKRSSYISTDLCFVHRHLHNNRIQRLGANGFDGLHNLETL